MQPYPDRPHVCGGAEEQTAAGAQAWVPSQIQVPTEEPPGSSPDLDLE